MHARLDGKRVFLVSEIVHNPSRCITNDPVKLANEVRRHNALRAKDMIWIEHYPERPRCGTTGEWLAECYELVRLSANRRGDFTAAESRRLTVCQVEDLISGRLQVVELFPPAVLDRGVRSSRCVASRLS
jgi:hypothetical protein